MTPATRFWAAALIALVPCTAIAFVALLLLNPRDGLLGLAFGVFALCGAFAIADRVTRPR